MIGKAFSISCNQHGAYAVLFFMAEKNLLFLKPASEQKAIVFFPWMKVFKWSILSDKILDIV